MSEKLQPMTRWERFKLNLLIAKIRTKDAWHAGMRAMRHPVVWLDWKTFRIGWKVIQEWHTPADSPWLPANGYCHRQVWFHEKTMQRRVVEW